MLWRDKDTLFSLLSLSFAVFVAIDYFCRTVPQGGTSDSPQAMEPISIQRLRAIQLDILDDVNRFCQEKGIRWSLCGGTLLGAVRHKGYIPWDDDIDLMMPRADFDRFAATYDSEKNELLDLRKADYTVEICLKVCRKGTRMVDLSLGRELWGINIDIFPIDGVPDDYPAFCRKILSERRTLAHICPFYKKVPARKAVWFAKYLLKRMFHPYFHDILYLKKEIDRLPAPYPPEDSRFAGVVLGSYGEKEVVPASVFRAMTQLPFEGRLLPAIRDYDTYLKAIYGDYMQLPPEYKRVTHHLYDAYADE